MRETAKQGETKQKRASKAEGKMRPEQKSDQQMWCSCGALYYFKPLDFINDNLFLT